MSSLKDGMGGEELLQSGLQNETGVSPYFLGSVTSASIVKGASVSTSNGDLKSVAVGSPSSVYGASIQAGSGVTGAGSSVWIVYPTAYTGAPTVVVSNITEVSKAVNIGSNTIGVGSFQVEAEAAADSFSWIAVGL